MIREMLNKNFNMNNVASYDEKGKSLSINEEQNLYLILRYKNFLGHQCPNNIKKIIQNQNTTYNLCRILDINPNITIDDNIQVIINDDKFTNNFIKLIEKADIVFIDEAILEIIKDDDLTNQIISISENKNDLLQERKILNNINYYRNDKVLFLYNSMLSSYSKDFNNENILIYLKEKYQNPKIIESYLKKRLPYPKEYQEESVKMVINDINFYDNVFFDSDNQIGKSLLSAISSYFLARPTQTTIYLKYLPLLDTYIKENYQTLTYSIITDCANRYITKYGPFYDEVKDTIPSLLFYKITKHFNIFRNKQHLDNIKELLKEHPDLLEYENSIDVNMFDEMNIIKIRHFLKNNDTHTLISNLENILNSNIKDFELAKNITAEINCNNNDVIKKIISASNIKNLIDDQIKTKFIFLFSNFNYLNNIVLDIDFENLITVISDEEKYQQLKQNLAYLNENYNYFQNLTRNNKDITLQLGSIINLMTNLILANQNDINKIFKIIKKNQLLFTPKINTNYYDYYDNIIELLEKYPNNTYAALVATYLLFKEKNDEEKAVNNWNELSDIEKLENDYQKVNQDELNEIIEYEKAIQLSSLIDNTPYKINVHQDVEPCLIELLISNYCVKKYIDQDKYTSPKTTAQIVNEIVNEYNNMEEEQKQAYENSYNLKKMLIKKKV